MDPGASFIGCRCRSCHSPLYCSASSRSPSSKIRRGMFRLVPSGRDLRMLIGRTPAWSSSSPNSIGDLISVGTSSSNGAPIDIWRALAPTILARSNRVSFLGPIRATVAFLELGFSFFFGTVFGPLGRSSAPFLRL